MRKLTDILVIVDTRKHQQTALNRAQQVAKTTGATLHILAPNPNADHHSWQKLETISHTLAVEDLSIHLHETWHRDITETIIHVQQMEGCQLVIKDAKAEGILAQAFGTPEDWRLLRQCDVPVLLVKHDKSWDHAPMMATINADHEDYQHTQLNLAILDYSASIADAFSAELHLASAYPTTRMPIQDSGNGLTFEHSYNKTCLSFARDYHLCEQNIHVKPGSAETVIPALINQQNIRLLVIGTHARTGISALAIGNTAEQLISHIDTDMLVLQPRDHMPPLEEQMDQKY